MTGYRCPMNCGEPCNCARSAEAMRRMFTEGRLSNAIEPGECISLFDDFVESINRRPGAPLSLARFKTADEYTYMHSLAAYVLMVALGLYCSKTPYGRLAENS